MAEIHQANCLSAWQEGVRLIRQSHREIFNLITIIEDPCQFDPAWIATYSPHAIVPTADRIVDVIDTVFPTQLRQRHSNRPAFYAAYARVHARAMKWRRNRGRWGTYFERLTDYNGETNQLERAITKLQTWPRNTTGLVFHLSCPTIDTPRTRGGPCWHYGEILWQIGDILDFVVVYRNHDFFNKALGNFIALGQLLQFIAAESNKQPGKLICHSAHAYSDKSMIALSQLAQV